MASKAVDFGDPSSGFRHMEVVRFINNEILVNGGGPDFYTAFRSRSWNEIEDQLRAVVINPQVPHTMKRACSWSALALSVRVGARQGEQQASRIRKLQDQLEQLEATCWALARELQWLREERLESNTKLRLMRANLQQVLNERNALHWRLLQAERAQANPRLHMVMPDLRAMEQLGAVALPQSMSEQGKMVLVGAQSMPHADTQMAASSVITYMPGPQGPWTQAGPSLPVPMPVPPVPPLPPPFQFHMPSPTGFSYSTSAPPGVMGSEGAAAAALTPHVPPLGMCPPTLWAPVSTQGMTPQYDQKCYGQEGNSDNLYGACYLDYTRSSKQGEGPACPQGAVDTKNYTQEDQQGPQGTALLKDSGLYSKKKYPVVSQEMNPLEIRKSLSLQGPESLPETSVQEYGESPDERKSPKKQESPGQKAKQPTVKKTSDSQNDENPDSGCSPVNWDCPSCNALNFPWSKTCYKCNNDYPVAKSGDLEPEPTL